MLLSVVQLSGCALTGDTLQACRIIDPDLAQGVYRGSCTNGWADGYGEVSGISRYEGDFVMGKKHGQGIKVMPNGDRYAGGFHDDFRHGKGSYVWGAGTPWAGDRYEGDYQRDRRHGWGVYQWDSGDRYEGPWQDDLRMGWSVMEQRRAQAAEAASNAAKVGTELCAEHEWEPGNMQLVRGTIERISAGLATVHISMIEGGILRHRGKTLTAGDRFSDEAAHWQPCTKL